MMNEAIATKLIHNIRTLLDELESEIRNHPESYVVYDENLYSEIKMYHEYNDDDGYPD